MAPCLRHAHTLSSNNVQVLQTRWSWLPSNQIRRLFSWPSPPGFFHSKTLHTVVNMWLFPSFFCLFHLLFNAILAALSRTNCKYKMCETSPVIFDQDVTAERILSFVFLSYYTCTFQKKKNRNSGTHCKIKLKNLINTFSYCTGKKRFINTKKKKTIAYRIINNKQ